MIIGIEAQRIFRRRKHGMDMVAVELIRNLQKIDKINSYYIFVKPGPDKVIEESSNFTIVELKGGPYPLWEQVALPRAVKKRGCQLLHCTSNTAPLYISTPTVVTLHDIIYLENSPFRGGSSYQMLGNLYRRWIVPPIIKKASKVVTVSKFEENTIVKTLPIKEKLSVIYNGVGEHFKPVTDQQLLEKHKREYNLPDQFILFFGNRAPKKNSQNLLRAYKRLLNRGLSIKLVVVDLTREELSGLLNEIHSRHLLDEIILIGYISNDLLPLTLNLATLFLYPSLRESFGIPIIEAMACGTPVITSNTSSMPEIGGDAALKVNPYNPDEITDAMVKVLKEPLLREQLIEAGYERVKLFSWYKMAQNYHSLYSSLLNG